MVDKKFIPPELKDLLLEFTISVMIEKPSDLIAYAADYFTEKRRQRSGASSSVRMPSSLSEADDEDTDAVCPQCVEDNLVCAQPGHDKRADRTESDDSRERLKAHIKDMPLFHDLDDSTFQSIIDNVEPRETQPGESIIEQGDEGDCFYLVGKGKFDVLMHGKEDEEKLKAVYHSHGYFGELSLIHNRPHAGVVLSMSHGLLWRLDKAPFVRLLMNPMCDKRNRYSPILKKIPELKHLTDYELSLVCDIIEEKPCDPGNVIFSEHEVNSCIYFVEEGKVDLYKQEGGKRKKKKTVHHGHWFGGLQEERREYTAEASNKAKVAALERKSFIYLPWTEGIEVLKTKLAKSKL